MDGSYGKEPVINVEMRFLQFIMEREERRCIVENVIWRRFTKFCSNDDVGDPEFIIEICQND